MRTAPMAGKWSVMRSTRRCGMLTFFGRCQHGCQVSTTVATGIIVAVVIPLVLEMIDEAHRNDASSTAHATLPAVAAGLLV